MKRLLLGALLLLSLIPQARAQDAQVISSCGSPPTTLLAGSVTPLFVDITGKLCSNAAGGGGSPGGLSGAVQFNSSGSFGGITGVTTNGTNLTISSTLIYPGAAVGTQVACLGLDASNNVVKNAAACGSGGGGTPGGSSTQLQYNAAGSFGGVAGATTNGTVVTFATNDLSLAGATSGNTLLNATAAAGAGTVATFPANTGTVAELNLAQSFSAVQTFSASNGIVYSGATVGTQVACIGLDGSNNLVKNAAACGLGTVTSISAGCGTSSGGSPITTTGTIFAAEVPNLRAGTTYTIANADCGTLNNFSNAAAIAVTLPQAGSGGNFANGWYNDVCSIGAGTATITPTTSTIGGVATLVLTTGKCARIVSDGTNYQVVTYGGGGGGGTPGGTSGQIQYNNASAFGGFGNWDGSAIFDLANAGTAQALHVYNTWSGGALPTPTNYERATIDWTTHGPSNLTIGTQAGGTGTARTIRYETAAAEAGGVSPHRFFSAGGGLWGLGTGETHTIIPQGAFFTWSQSTSGGSPDYTASDIGLARATTNLLDVNNGQTLGAVAFMRLNGVVVASLPACSATFQGARGTVTNASQTFTAGIGAIVAGGGANIVPVFCDGTNWRIG